MDLNCKLILFYMFELRSLGYSSLKDGLYDHYYLKQKERIMDVYAKISMTAVVLLALMTLLIKIEGELKKMGKPIKLWYWVTVVEVFIWISSLITAPTFLILSIWR